MESVAVRETRGAAVAAVEKQPGQVAKPFSCIMCKKSFAVADQLDRHVAKMHGNDSAEAKLALRLPPKSEPGADFMNVDPDQPVDLSADGIGKKSRTPLIISVDQTPTPTRLLSALEHSGIFAQTPFRAMLGPDNPFGAAFRTGLSSLATSKGDLSPLLSPSALNPILFQSPLSPLIKMPTADSGGDASAGLYFISPGGPFGVMRSPQPLMNIGQYLTTTPQFVAVPSGGIAYAAPTTTGNIFSGFTNQYYQSLLPKRDSELQESRKDDLSDDIPRSSISQSSQPKSSDSSLIEVDSPVKKDSKVSTDPAANQLIRDSIKRRIEDYLTENNSETQSVVSGDSSAAPTARRSRPILETDDPVLADKRRRNRIAAEKCRKRRKDVRDSLEKNNKDLETKFKVLSAKFSELRDASRQAVEELQAENQALRNENDVLRNRIGMPNGAVAVKPSLLLLKSVIPDTQTTKNKVSEN